MTFKIDKDVPIPQVLGQYPFEQMEIGDSFFAAGHTTNQIQNAASNHRKKGKKFRSRRVTENGVEGTRIWRIE